MRVHARPSMRMRTRTHTSMHIRRTHAFTHRHTHRSVCGCAVVWLRGYVGVREREMREERERTDVLSQIKALTVLEHRQRGASHGIAVDNVLRVCVHVCVSCHFGAPPPQTHPLRALARSRQTLLSRASSFSLSGRLRTHTCTSTRVRTADCQMRIGGLKAGSEGTLDTLVTRDTDKLVKRTHMAIYISVREHKHSHVSACVRTCIDTGRVGVREREAQREGERETRMRSWLEEA